VLLPAEARAVRPAAAQRMVPEHDRVPVAVSRSVASSARSTSARFVSAQPERRLPDAPLVQPPLRVEEDEREPRASAAETGPGQPSGGTTDAPRAATKRVWRFTASQPSAPHCPVVIARHQVTARARAPDDRELGVEAPLVFGASLVVGFVQATG